MLHKVVSFAVPRASEAVNKSHQTFHRGDAEAQRFENKGSFLCVSATQR